jgi:hypothetical protein
MHPQKQMLSPETTSVVCTTLAGCRSPVSPNCLAWLLPAEISPNLVTVSSSSWRLLNFCLGHKTPFAGFIGPLLGPHASHWFYTHVFFHTPVVGVSLGLALVRAARHSGPIPGCSFPHSGYQHVLDAATLEVDLTVLCRSTEYCAS